MSESTKWQIKGSRVYGAGKSFNCTNKVTAEQLYCTLTEYEKTIQLTQNPETKLNNITKSITTLQTDLSNVQDTLNKIKKELTQWK